MSSSKLYIKKRNRQRQLGVLVDLEDYLRYHHYRLRLLPDGRIYFTDKGKKKYLSREILRLTDPKKRVFFRSVNKLDLRKSNLMVRAVPENNRGRYAVQFVTPYKN
jgi:hypothetical protein